MIAYIFAVIEPLQKSLILCNIYCAKHTCCYSKKIFNYLSNVLKRGRMENLNPICYHYCINGRCSGSKTTRVQLCTDFAFAAAETMHNIRHVIMLGLCM